MTDHNNTESDTDERPENIQIRVVISDPNAADGEAIRQTRDITFAEFEMVRFDPYGYVESIIHGMGSHAARKWADEREAKKHTEECQRYYGAHTLALYACPECGHGWHPVEQCDHCGYAVCWCVGHDDYPPIRSERPDGHETS